MRNISRIGDDGYEKFSEQTFTKNCKHMLLKHSCVLFIKHFTVDVVRNISRITFSYIINV